jgi:hypothetical protein
MVRLVRIFAILVGLIANLIPLCGVLFWQWDTFQLLMLYWMETVIIAFWTIRRIARLPSAQLGTLTVNGQSRPATHKMLCGFLSLHAGAFILAHLFFLWVMFSWDWLKRVHGLASFFDELLVANGLWLALIFMFVAGWISYLTSATTDPTTDLSMAATEKTPAQTPTGKSDPVGSIIGGLYGRIVITQIAIIAGAWFAQSYGSIAPLLIVIGLKTLADMAATIGGSSPISGVTLSSGNTSMTR